MIFLFWFFFTFAEHKTVLWVLPHTLCIHIIHQTATRRDRKNPQTKSFYILHTWHETTESRTIVKLRNVAASQLLCFSFKDVKLDPTIILKLECQSGIEKVVLIVICMECLHKMSNKTKVSESLLVTEHQHILLTVCLSHYSTCLTRLILEVPFSVVWGEVFTFKF